MAQREVKLGGGGVMLYHDDAPVPSRSASLAFRAMWAVTYLHRFGEGHKLSKKLFDLALKWIDELLVEHITKAKLVSSKTARGEIKNLVGGLQGTGALPTKWQKVLKTGKK
jgi:hypothetical protein